jgi:sugar phosphate isomerase/epimerase
MERSVDKGQIGLELYTVRSLATTDMIGTLRKVAEVGYPTVEFAGYGGVPASELRAVLDDLGLKAVASHVPLDHFANRFDEVVVELQTLGIKDAIVPWVAPERRAEFFADNAALARTFNDWGARCRNAGLRFGYHNHDFEFAPAPNGKGTLLDALLDATDPSLVHLELDAYWAAYAEVDPISILQRYTGRVPILHVKDMAAGSDRAIAAVGEGVLPWGEILAAAEDAGTEWFIVEQDNPKDPLVDIATSLRNLEAVIEAA